MGWYIMSESGENKRDEVLNMGLSAKPIKVPFVVKSSKIQQFRAQESGQIIREIQGKAMKISNIKAVESTDGEKK